MIELSTINLDTPNGWNDLNIRINEVCQAQVRSDSATPGEWGWKLLKNGLESNARSVILEPAYICKDHRSLISAYYSRKFHPNPDRTTRLHFFSDRIDKQDLLLNPSHVAQHYLGYSVIRPVAKHCIGRSIFDPHKMSLIKNGKLYCLKTGFSAHISGNEYRIQGFPYISQDVDATSCGHSALWTVMRFLSERYHLYRETYPSQIVALADASGGRKIPYRGLFYTDYLRILSDFGCYPIFLRTKERQKETRIDPKEYMNMCSYIESGFPIIASYGDHAVAIIGHTLDLTRNPMADSNGFIDTSGFWRHLVTIDDNFFPFQLLGYSSDSENYGNKYGYSIDSIWVCVCPLPEKAFLPAEIARTIAYNRILNYREKLVESGDGNFVVRLFMTTGVSLKKRKLEMIENGVGPGIDWPSYFIKDISLPHFVWVMEVSSVDEYKNGRCRAEIILDTTANENEQPMIYARIGRWVILPDKEPKKWTEKIENLSYPQYTHNLGEA